MLTFNLKKEWFEKIKSGEKTHEYRECKPYWTDRFIKEFFKVNKKTHPYQFRCYQAGMVAYLKRDKAIYNNPTICFMNGMIPENQRPRLYAKLKTITIINGKNTDLHIDKPVYDIEFELLTSQEAR